MTRLRLLALLLGSLLGTAQLVGLPALASADDPEPEVSDQVEEPAAVDPLHRVWDRLLGVELTGGVDTPFGVIGGAILVQPIRNLRLDIGGGASRDGGRFAGGATVVLPQDHFALMMRLGFAGGPLTWDEGRETQIHRSWGLAAFLDTSIGLEYHFDEGVLIRLYAGVETTLNSSADTCSATSATPETICGSAVHDHPARLFGGLSVGYMFDIYP
jgi:hypothetical protein